MGLSCESCGARLDDGAERCDICGTVIGEGADAHGQESGIPESAISAPSNTKSASSESARRESGSGPFCTSCGTQNPQGAKFCYACGKELVKAPRAVQASDVPATSAPVASTPASNAPVGRQIAIVLSAAVLVIVALYVITTLSRDEPASLVPDETGAVTLLDEAPLPEQFQAEEADLTERLDAATDSVERVGIRRELVDLYLSAARLDLAAGENARIAELTGQEVDWVAAGNMYYDWMETKPVPERGPWAKQAISAYRRALELNPANTDVRTDMAIAYMYDPDNPMLAIQETNAVLEQDSLHIQANFNRGIMLMQINRIDQARTQFEKVQRLIDDPENPIWQRAAEALTRLDSPQP